MKKDTYEWGFWSESRTKGALARSRLLKLSVRNASRLLRPKRSLFNSDSFKSIKNSLWVNEDYRSELYFESAGVVGPCVDLVPYGARPSRFVIPTLPMDGKRSEHANEPLIDVRDFLDRSVSAREVIMSGDVRGVLEEGDDMMREDGVHIIGDCNAGFVRLFSRGGVGIAPPSEYRDTYWVMD
jgi:hypothetical protein